MERISRDIDVPAVVILEVEPCHIARRENLFNCYHALLWPGRIFPAQQERNRFARSERTSEEVGGNPVHKLTSQERDSTGISSRKARTMPGFHREGSGLLGRFVEGQFLVGFLLFRGGLLRAVELEDGVDANRVGTDRLLRLLGRVLGMANLALDLDVRALLERGANSPSLPKTMERCHSVCEMYSPDSLSL